MTGIHPIIAKISSRPWAAASAREVFDRHLPQCFFENDFEFEDWWRTDLRNQQEAWDNYKRRGNTAKALAKATDMIERYVEIAYADAEDHRLIDLNQDYVEHFQEQIFPRQNATAAEPLSFAILMMFGLLYFGIDGSEVSSFFTTLISQAVAARIGEGALDPLATLEIIRNETCGETDPS